jgi:hypothetical protein
MRDCESREFVFTSATPKPYFIGRSIILLIERSNRRLRQRGSDNPIAHVFQWSHEEHRLLPMRVLTKLCPSARQAGIAGIILNLQMETAPTGCSSPSERIAKRFSMKRSFQSLMFYSRPALLAPKRPKRGCLTNNSHLEWSALRTSMESESYVRRVHLDELNSDSCLITLEGAMLHAGPRGHRSQSSGESSREILNGRHIKSLRSSRGGRA